MKPGTIEIVKGNDRARINQADLEAWTAQGWKSSLAPAPAPAAQEGAPEAPRKAPRTRKKA